MGLIDTVVVTIVVLGGVFILYKALKEPVDFVFGFLGRGLVKAKDALVGATAAGENYYEEISYG